MFLQYLFFIYVLSICHTVTHTTVCFVVWSQKKEQLKAKRARQREREERQFDEEEELRQRREGIHRKKAEKSAVFMTSIGECICVRRWKAEYLQYCFFFSFSFSPFSPPSLFCNLRVIFACHQRKGKKRYTEGRVRRRRAKL